MFDLRWYYSRLWQIIRFLTIMKYSTCDETHFMIFIIDSVTALFELLNVSHKELECCYGNYYVNLSK